MRAAVATVSGNMSIVNNAPNSRTSVGLSGAGIAPTYLLGANPTSLSFGNVNVGNTDSLSATLTNNGNSNVTVSSVTPTGTGFSASGITTGTILSPNQSATLNVAFAPLAAGTVTGAVTVLSNATNSPATVTLSAVGIPATTPPFPVWVAPGLVRVGKADAPGTTSLIIISGARGETLDTQVIIRPPTGGLTNVNMSASPLTGPGGATIPASNFVFYPAYYVTVHGSYKPAGNHPPLGPATHAQT